MSEIVLIVAAAEKNVIGKDGAIPWRLPEDLRRFKALTTGKTVIMGRKTWDSLPIKPLPKRWNVVVTRNPDWTAPNATRVNLLHDALDIAASHKSDAMIIGGAEIYRAALPLAKRIELTEIHQNFDGDAVFQFDKADWHETAREDRTSDSGLGYSFVTLERR
jgi:dihydrofolate reductase